jgi:K+/H+ antiporter YhaU regulatory subunit KhtT
MLRTAASPAVPVNTPGIDIDGASTETIVLDAVSPVVGKNLGELNLRGESGATVIAVLRGGDTKISPGANYKLKEGDTVVLLGSAKKIARAISIIQPKTEVGGFNA